MRRSIPRKQHEEILAAKARQHEKELADLTVQLDGVKADNERLRSERDQFAKDRDAALLEAEEIAVLADDPGAVLAVASDEEIAAWEARVKAHWAWKPAADPEKRPIDGASGRPTHPATDLRRALDRLRALQARMDQRRKRVAS